MTHKKGQINTYGLGYKITVKRYQWRGQDFCVGGDHKNCTSNKSRL